MEPHGAGRNGRIYSYLPPPRDFIAAIVQLAMMPTTQRYRELVADLASHGAGLGEPQMVGVGGASSTDQAGLRCNKLEVGSVAEPTRLANRKYTFVDLGGGVVTNVC